VIRLANFKANGRPLESNEFEGGEQQTNRFLEKMGFKIFPK
jgi:hypothetical protein